MSVSMKTLRKLAAAGLLAAAAAPGAAAAQDWSGQVTLYGWGAGVGGDFTPFAGAPTLSFDKSLSEVLDDLDGAFFATALVRRGDLVLFGDFTYSSASRAGLVPPGIPASGELTIRSLTLAGGRRFDAGRGRSVDVMAGLRAWSVDGLVRSPVLSVAPEVNFVDPILALRGTAPLSDRWSMLGYVDVGGFGAGSDLTWQAAITANYQATERLYFSLGWRHLYLDYSDGGSRFDGAMTGPLAGVTWRF